MKAVVCHEGQLAPVDLPAPRPMQGQVLLQVSYCGICGSDLHARHHADRQADALAEVGYTGAMRAHQRIVLGHEFSGTVAEYGPGCREQVPTGAAVVALPLLRTSADINARDGLDAIGISAAAAGAYAEQVLVQESLMLPVPNGLSTRTAALTEPMAIGWHAVRRSEISRRDVAIVVGCGPVGLAVISLLKARKVRTVIASDPSPNRRELACAFGADVLVDPGDNSPYDAAGDHQWLRTVPDAANLGLATTEKLQRLPIPWYRTWRVIDTLGIAPKRPVIFECVGIPGMLDEIITGAPMYSRVVAVGVCMTPDTIRPVIAINKEIDLRFVVGYTPLEFHDTLHMLADGKIEPNAMLTGTVGLRGVDAAFAVLADAGHHAKILIDPTSTHATPAAPYAAS